MGHKGLKKIFEQAKIECLDLSVRQIHVIHQVRTSAQINRHLSKGFIQWNRGKSESLDPRLFAQRLMQGLSHDNPDIFHRVVLVDVDIALGLDRQVEEAVFGEEIQHMVKEPNGSVDLPPPGAIQIPCDTDIRFLRGTVKRGLPGDTVLFHANLLSADLACASKPSICASRTIWSLACVNSSLV